MNWWDEMAVQADEAGDRFSAAWYAAMSVLYVARFPDSDERSRQNMRDMAERAAEREGVLFAPRLTTN